MNSKPFVDSFKKPNWAAVEEGHIILQANITFSTIRLFEKMLYHPSPINCTGIINDHFKTNGQYLAL